jgi:hypothetical protein
MERRLLPDIKSLLSQLNSLHTYDAIPNAEYEYNGHEPMDSSTHIMQAQKKKYQIT